MNVPRDQTHKYGILDIQQDHGKIIHVKGLVEKPAPELAPSTLSIIGRYILQPEIFQFLSAFEKGAGGEIQLTDAMGKLLSTQNFYGFRFDGTRYDCGSHLGFIEANIAFALNDPIIGNDVRAILKKMEI
jgi:UTP--glucose-1-phosphate uridylyltransferase